MGSACSRSTIGFGGVRTTASAKLDLLLEEAKVREELHFKILCLGAGESGKSTIVKQLTFIHKQLLSKEERQSYVRVLQTNTLQCMVTLIKEAETFNYTFLAPERPCVNRLLAHDQRHSPYSSFDIDITTLWFTTAIQRAWSRRNEFWHLEASEYYFLNVKRFVLDGFIPSEEDIVMARKRTTGVVITELEYGGVHWSCVDVGGQRSERRKWLNCFDNVKAIIYVVNLAGYCKVLFEDKAVNRMHESLNLFEATMSNPTFASTPVFIFLNKKDLFESLIRDHPLTYCFPDYSGDNSLTSCIDHITEAFSKRLPMAYNHRPTFLLLAARVKKDVQYCFEEVKDILLDMHERRITKAQRALLRVEKRNRLTEDLAIKKAKQQMVDEKERESFNHNREEERENEDDDEEDNNGGGGRVRGIFGWEEEGIAHEKRIKAAEEGKRSARKEKSDNLFSNTNKNNYNFNNKYSSKNSSNLVHNSNNNSHISTSPTSTNTPTPKFSPSSINNNSNTANLLSNPTTSQTEDPYPINKNDSLPHTNNQINSALSNAIIEKVKEENKENSELSPAEFSEEETNDSSFLISHTKDTINLIQSIVTKNNQQNHIGEQLELSSEEVYPNTLNNDSDKEITNNENMNENLPKFLEEEKEECPTTMTGSKNQSDFEKEQHRPAHFIQR